MNSVKPYTTSIFSEPIYIEDNKFLFYYVTMLEHKHFSENVKSTLKVNKTLRYLLLEMA
jgi:hypothetical protein